MRKLSKVDEVNTVPRRWVELLAAGADISELQQSYLEMRQPLEWVLRQVGSALPAQSRSALMAGAKQLPKAPGTTLLVDFVAG